jgi:hypothetical protein
LEKKEPDKRISQKLQAKIGEERTWEKNLTKDAAKKLEKKESHKRTSQQLKPFLLLYLEIGPCLKVHPLWFPPHHNVVILFNLGACQTVCLSC